MPQRANVWQATSGFVSDGSLYDGSNATGYQNTISPGSAGPVEIAVKIDLGVGAAAVKSLFFNWDYSNGSFDQTQRLWESSNDDVTYTTRVNPAPSFSGPGCGGNFNQNVPDTLATAVSARFWRLSVRVYGAACSSIYGKINEVECKDAGGAHIPEVVAPQSINPDALVDSDAFPTPLLTLDLTLDIPFALRDFESFPEPNLQNVFTLSVAALIESDYFPLPSMVNSTGSSTLAVEPLVDTESFPEAFLANSGNLKFRFCPDSKGIKWRDEVAVANADQYAAAGCWLNNAYGVLYTQLTVVKFITAVDANDWSGSTPISTGFKGRVRGLAHSAQGILMGLLDGDGTDPKKKGVTPIVSRDRGQTWEKRTAIPLVGERSVTSIANIFFVVETTTDGFRHYQSLDAGDTWK